MNYTLKLFGAALVMLFSLVIGRSYREYCGRRVEECEGFLSLLNHIIAEISQFLSTPKDFFESFECEALRRVGFLSEIEEGRDMSAAFETIKGRLSLSGETLERLSGFFSDFGRSYRDGEIERTKYFRDELERTWIAEREAEEKRVKLVYTLLLALSLSIVILLI